MKRLVELFNNSRIIKRIMLCLVALLFIAGCLLGVLLSQRTAIPELTTYVDGVGSIEVEQEEVPLSKPEVTVEKKTKTTKKTIKLKKASKKTYKKTKTTKTKRTSKKTKKSVETVKVEKTVVTNVTESFKKKSNIKTVTTKITTTIKTTVTKVNDSSVSEMMGNSASDKKAVEPYVIEVDKIAPFADAKVRKAYRILGFDVVVDGAVAYAGYFNARERRIVLRQGDDTIYHELGHFLAFIAGNMDLNKEFIAIYHAEKKNYKRSDADYITQNSSEYFAESFRDYVLDPEKLQRERPRTYNSIVDALNKINDTWIMRIQKVYSSVWK